MTPEVIHDRKDYTQGDLNEADLHSDPLEQFQRWFQTAVAAKLPEPYAMTLATVDATGQPSARVVLLRGVDATGFQFFTNYHSRKGEELTHNAHAALLFYWAELERQVRVEGMITRTSDAVSDSYFAQRPRASQIAAVASSQSVVIASRQVLEHKVAELNQLYEGQPVPRPPHWGGYTLTPHRFEFWQGRRSRLHDRLCYRPTDRPAGPHWIIERLSP